MFKKKGLSKKQKREIIEESKKWMRKNIIEQHLKNTRKLEKLEE